MIIETREVLAGVYRRRTGQMLSHAVEVNDAGDELRVLCTRVDVLSLADHCAQDTTQPPTCPACAAQLRKLRRQGHI